MNSVEKLFLNPLILRVSMMKAYPKILFSLNYLKNIQKTVDYV